MQSLYRGLGMVFAFSMVLVIFGCAEDNEAFVKAQAAANASTDKTAGTPAPRPKDQVEYFKQQQQQQAGTYSKSSGYPGAKSK